MLEVVGGEVCLFVLVCLCGAWVCVGVPVPAAVRMCASLHVCDEGCGSGQGWEALW